MIKRVLLGRPIATAEEMQERLPKKLALPVFSADAISSTAYATEEILLALVLAGAVALHYSIYVSLAVAALLAIVALSYQQTVHAYPSGGGSYIVSRENLGLAPGLVAASSLMVDYVMTVAVSTASGVAALTSAFPSLYSYRVIICVGVVVLVAVANLRGMRESGTIFAFPTYAFVLLCGGLVVVGMVRWFMGDLPPQLQHAPAEATQSLTIFLILKAFSGGCSAMTGTEAISNAVPAFKPPESRNAGITLGIMASVLGFLLIGVTALSQIIHVAPVLDGSDTVLSQVGRAVYGNGTAFYFALQIATMAILFLGANTSYAGFPRLSSVLARDGLMPRQFMNRGDRLVFSNGIIGLTVAAVAVVVIFGAQTHRMIPLRYRNREW
jgi:amino acid transporter